MADLFDRLFPGEAGDETKIAVHYFYAALVDLAAGKSNKAEIVAGFNLDATAEAQLDLLITGYQNATDKNRWLHELQSAMMLAEAGLKYTTKQGFAARMGL